VDARRFVLDEGIVRMRRGERHQRGARFIVPAFRAQRRGRFEAHRRRAWTLGHHVHTALAASAATYSTVAIAIPRNGMLNQYFQPSTQ